MAKNKVEMSEEYARELTKVVDKVAVIEAGEARLAKLKKQLRAEIRLALQGHGIEEFKTKKARALLVKKTARSATPRTWKIIAESFSDATLLSQVVTLKVAALEKRKDDEDAHRALKSLKITERAELRIDQEIETKVTVAQKAKGKTTV